LNEARKTRQDIKEEFNKDIKNPENNQIEVWKWIAQ
jgi:hypothetical protein